MKITDEDVREALWAEDIEGLLELGAPQNEYAAESRSIAGALAGHSETALSEEELASVIRAVWLHSFGPFSTAEMQKRSDVFRQVAHRILHVRISTAPEPHHSAEIHP